MVRARHGSDEGAEPGRARPPPDGRRAVRDGSDEGEVVANLGLTLAVAGAVMTVVGAIGAAWSLRRMPGTSAGVAVSFACAGLAFGGVVVAAVGAVVGHG